MIFTYNSPKTPFILLKTKLSPVTCHHIDNEPSHLNSLATNVLRYFYVSPKSAVFVPESAVFSTYDLEVSTFFRNFALVLRILSNTGKQPLPHAFVAHYSPVASHKSFYRPPPVTIFPLSLSTIYNTRSLTF